MKGEVFYRSIASGDFEISLSETEPYDVYITKADKNIVQLSLVTLWDLLRDHLTNISVYLDPHDKVITRRVNEAFSAVKFIQHYIDDSEEHETIEKDDNINHPSHYTQGKIEVIDFIEDQNFNYLEGNIVKYICRYRFKGTPVDDLKKALWYLNRLIKKERER